MEYNLSEVHTNINQFVDKMGSDYFPLPEVLNNFRVSTYDFIDSQLKIAEETQQVVEDIRPLVFTSDIPVIIDPNNSSRYIAAIPADYHRVLSYDLTYKDGSRCITADMKSHTQHIMQLNNPNRNPTKQYPTITQEADLFAIYCGTGNPKLFKMVICKKPKIATTGEPNKRIVNLPNAAIEKIMLSVCTRLLNKTGDERSQSSYAIQEAFRKTFQ